MRGHTTEYSSQARLRAWLSRPCPEKWLLRSNNPHLEQVLSCCSLVLRRCGIVQAALSMSVFAIAARFSRGVPWPPSMNQAPNRSSAFFAPMPRGRSTGAEKVSVLCTRACRSYSGRQRLRSVIPLLLHFMTMRRRSQIGVALGTAQVVALGNRVSHFVRTRERDRRLRWSVVKKRFLRLRSATKTHCALALVIPSRLTARNRYRCPKLLPRAQALRPERTSSTSRRSFPTSGSF
jgi:hypothetical protein